MDPNFPNPIGLWDVLIIIYGYTPAFSITSDVLATTTQVAGAAIIGAKESNREDPTIGNNILLRGLAYQVFSLGVFVILRPFSSAREGSSGSCRLRNSVCRCDAARLPKDNFPAGGDGAEA